MRSGPGAFQLFLAALAGGFLRAVPDFAIGVGVSASALASLEASLAKTICLDSAFFRFFVKDFGYCARSFVHQRFRAWFGAFQQCGVCKTSDLVVSLLSLSLGPRHGPPGFGWADISDVLSLNGDPRVTQALRRNDQRMGVVPVFAWSSLKPAVFAAARKALRAEPTVPIQCIAASIRPTATSR
ncbi:hypothetical protein SuNHUV7_26970 (plasmid) [Pseudoseohaeicola sp. NH-UV-7]